MSRFSESPSPAGDRHQAAPRGRRRPPADDGYDDRWIGRSRSGQRTVRGRGSANLPPGSRSRSPIDGYREAPREAPRERRRRRRAEPAEPPPESVDDLDGTPPPRQRGERRQGERPRPSRRHADAGGAALDGEPREGERGRGRRTGRDRDREARKMMEAQQAQMRMMGMMGMHNPAAMQMAMMGQMGMMNPAYMQMMQQQQQMMMGKRGGKRDGSSSDSDSSSGESSNGVPNPAAAMAAMAAMSQWPASASAGQPPQANPGFRPPPGMPPLPPPPPPPGGFQAGGGDGDSEAKKAKDGADNKEGDAAKANREPPRQSARGSAKKEIENMISEYRLSVGCAWTMRALAPDKQKLAARIDPSGQADPSGYVAEELKKIV